MAVIHLIRHAQASFGSEDYDQLSELGRRQARALGGHIRQHGMPLDVLVSGSLRRHVDTTAEINEALGARAPATLVEDAFNEYDHVGVIHAYLPLFMQSIGDPRGLKEADIISDHKLFEFAFRFMIKAWMDHLPHEHQGLEDWRDFCKRVVEGLNGLLAAHEPKARIGIVTSGGSIAAVLRAVLGLSNKRTLSMNWSIYNASVTQLYYGRSLSHEDALLLGFNNVAHLESLGGREFITFR